MAHKPDHYDLAMEALSHQLAQAEYELAAKSLMLQAALDVIADLHKRIAGSQRWRYLEKADLEALRADADRAEALNGEA